MAGVGALLSISSLDYCHRERMCAARAAAAQPTASFLQNWVRAVRAGLIPPPPKNSRGEFNKMEVK